VGSSNFTQGQKRRGLVLAGGGAKGAYAFGCLRAFRKAGISFEAVAGTSVGALNALLWSADRSKDFDVGKKLWRQISFDNIYPSRLPWRSSSNPHLKWLSGKLSWCLGVTYVVFRLIVSAFAGVAVPLRALWVSPIILMSVVPGVAIDLLLGNSGLDSAIWGCLPFGCLGFLGMLSRRKRMRRLGLKSALTPFFVPIAFAAGGLTYILLSPFLHFEKPGVIPLLGNLLLGLATLVGGFTGAYLVLDRSGRALKRWLDWLTSKDTSILCQSGLAKSITILAGNALSSKAIVCVAQLKEIFDPDRTKWTTDDTVTTTTVVSDSVFAVDVHDAPNAIYYPDVMPEWIPSYAVLNGLQAEKIRDLCLASAALPFGIVPSVEIDGVQYSDGGTCDNVPVFPLLNMGLDEIVVILLAPYRNEAKLMRDIGVDSEVWSERDRLQRIAQIKIPKPTRQPPRKRQRGSSPSVPLRSLPSMPNVVLLSPTKTLGGFLSGTLNFDTSYAKRLEMRGYRDAQRFMRTSKLQVE